MNEHLHARGHENVSAAHASTFEVTTDDYLTPAGDCIIGIAADHAPADFDRSFVEACRNHEATIVATISVGDRTETATGRGHPDLTFDSLRSTVVRTSDYVDDRTVMVGADVAAADLDREMVAALAAGDDVRLELRVEG